MTYDDVPKLVSKYVRKMKRIMRRNRENNARVDERDSYRRSEMEFGVAADAYRSDPSKKATRNGAVAITITFALAVFVAVVGLWWIIAGSINIAGILIALLAGLGCSPRRTCASNGSVASSCASAASIALQGRDCSSPFGHRVLHAARRSSARSRLLSGRRRL